MPVPAFGYAPETRGYVGAVCLFNKRFGKDSMTRASNAKIEFNYSQRKQIITELGWNIYTKGEQMFLFGDIHVSKYPDYFWTQTDSGAADKRLTFSSNRNIADAAFFFQIHPKGKWYTGPILRYIFYNHIALTSNDTIPLGKIGLSQTKRYSVVGWGIQKDTRDNILQAKKGGYLLATSQRMSGGNRIYFNTLFDVRKYFSNEKSVLALRYKTHHSAGPMLDAAVFGEDASARGFYFGRYRPKFYHTLQSEARMRIYRRWSLAMFGGFSYLNRVYQGVNLYVWNAGTGIRFLIDRKGDINLRLDMAWGRYNNSGFYVAFGESF